MTADYRAVMSERYGLPDPALPCVCGHLGTLHAIGRRGGEPARTTCSASGCGCTRYEVGTMARTHREERLDGDR